MKIGAIVQARMGSTRLPGKVLLPLGRGTVLSCLIERLKKVERLDVIVIATTYLKEDALIVEEAEKNGVEVFCGDVEDVLKRYVRAILKFGIDYVVRVTSDCPFLYYEGVGDLIEMHLREGADYSLNVQKSIKIYDTGMPHGLESEVFTAASLIRADSETHNLEDREHVTLYLEAHPKIFKIRVLKAPPEIYNPGMRLTLDTREDYILIKKVYDTIYNGRPIPTNEVIKFLKENPELININRNIPAKPLARKIINN
jgi:spore coat polysaccharide biosynthesis protein SpsF